MVTNFILVSLMNNLKKIVKNTKTYWLLLTLSLTITVAFSAVLLKEAHYQARKDFLYQINLAETGLDSKVAVYEQILKDVVGLFNTLHIVNKEQWESYMDTVKFHDKFPTLKWIAFAQVLNIQNNHNNVYASNIFLYPNNIETHHLLSYDLAHNEKILHSMMTARDTGNMSVSDRVNIVNSKNKLAEDSFLMILPVYKKIFLVTKQDKIDNILGYICSPFASRYSLESIFNELNLKVDLKVYDGTTISAKNLVYSSHNDLEEQSVMQRLDNALFRISKIKTYFKYGKSYTIVYTTKPSITAHNFNWLLFLLIGSIISFSVFFIVRALVFTNEKAFKLAEEMTQEIRKNKEQLEGLAHYDALTQVANRYFFKKLLHHAIDLANRHHTKLALFFIDLDCFKIINDNLGHEVGDKVLKEVASRMKDCLRSVDTVGRLGGDEFVLLVEKEVSVEQISIIAQNIIKKINEPFLINEHIIKIGCSIGVATFPEHAQNMEKLMNKADKAMYCIKKKGKNNFMISC